MATLSVGERWYNNAFFLPVGTSAAALICSVLVARAHPNAGIEIPVGEAVVRGREALLTVERGTKAWDDAAYLISRPISKKASACLLKEVSMARVEANAASVSIRALLVLLTSFPATGNPLVVIGWRVKVPFASAGLRRSRVLRTRVSTCICIAIYSRVHRCHRNGNVDTVDDFYIVEIDILFGKSHFRLSCRLHETLGGLAITDAIVATVSSTTVLAIGIASSSTCDCPAPYDVKAIIINRNVDVFLLSLLDFEDLIVRCKILEEALGDRSSLDTL